jgi:hypothetical protein
MPSLNALFEQFLVSLMFLGEAPDGFRTGEVRFFTWFLRGNRDTQPIRFWIFFTLNLMVGLWGPRQRS